MRVVDVWRVLRTRRDRVRRIRGRVLPGIDGSRAPLARGHAAEEGHAMRADGRAKARVNNGSRTLYVRRALKGCAELTRR